MYAISEIKKMNKETAKQAKGKQPYIAGKTTTFDDLKKIPNFGDYRPKGWTETENYFVDSSGFGREDKPALTISRFISKIKPGYGYAITEVGQFQIYITEFRKS